MVKDVFCPVCKAHGYTKLLLRVSDGTVGTLYVKCRGCRHEVKIVLRKSEPKGSPFVKSQNLQK